MSSIFDIFGKSPFKPLQDHMAQVKECTDLVPELVEAFFEGNSEHLHAVARKIFDAEHKADTVKNSIRDNLPRSIFLPVDRRDLLEILSSQDAISDTAEDLAALLKLREKAAFPPELKDDFRTYVNQSLKTVNVWAEIISELDVLVETSFNGPEAMRAVAKISELGALEHEADKIQYQLSRRLIEMEDTLKPTEAFHWHKVFRVVGDLANAAEHVGDRMRLLLSK